MNLNPFRTIPLIEQVERLLSDAHEALIVDELELRRWQARVKMSAERLRYLEAKHTELTKVTP